MHLPYATYIQTADINKCTIVLKENLSPVYYSPCPAPLIMLRRPVCFRVYMWAFTVGIDMSGGRLISTRSHSYSPTSHDLIFELNGNFWLRLADRKYDVSSPPPAPPLLRFVSFFLLHPPLLPTLLYLFPFLLSTHSLPRLVLLADGENTASEGL